jgi:alpha-tubulin suppressor-like RCC1 family protein
MTGRHLLDKFGGGGGGTQRARVPVAVALLMAALLTPAVRRTSPAQAVTVSPRVTVLAVGSGHTCALKNDTTVACWGSNHLGQLGLPASTGTQPVPTTVPGLSGVAQIASGDSHMCAVLVDQTAVCWGLNSNGQIGDGTTTQRNTPTPVLGLTGVVQMSAATENTCAVLSTGRVACWGSAFYGQIGDGVTYVTPKLTPGLVSGLTDAVQVTVGSHHVCALRSTGSVVCWGVNFSGLGDGVSTLSRVPVAVLGLTDVTQIAAGWSHTCAVNGDTTVSCWGYNGNGQLGDGTTFGRSSPVSSTDASRFKVQVGAGLMNTCGLGPTNHTIQCWGNNSGDIINPNAPGSNFQVAVSQPKQIAVGIVHTCALQANGGVMCWGNNSNGQLGDQTNTTSLTPVAVQGFSGVPSFSVPSAPFALVANPQIGSVALNWPLSVDDGGTPITGYAITVLPTGQVFNVDTTGSFVISGLVPGTAYTFQVRARNAVGLSLPAASPTVTLPSTPVPPPGEVTGPYTAVTPSRVLDTRTGNGSAPGKLTTGQILAVKVSGRGGVPLSTPGVVMNLTVTDPESDGYVTVFPCDVSLPNASNLNVVAGQTVPNLVSVRLDASGRVCLFSTATTQLIADVAGYMAPTGSSGSSFTSVTPARILDTRTGNGAGKARLTAGQTLTLQVSGRGGVAPGAMGVVMNVTVTDPASAGYVTVYPCDASLPDASNLNVVAGQTVPNLVSVRLDGSGRVCLFSTVTTHLIADVAGFYSTSGSLFSSLSPARILDTRTGIGAPIAKLSAGQTLTLQVSGRGGVSAGATGAAMNVTVTDPASAGYVTVYPCDAPLPDASNLNVVAGQTVPNLVSVRLDGSGRVCLFSTITTHLIADVSGYYLPPV